MSARTAATAVTAATLLTAACASTGTPAPAPETTTTTNNTPAPDPALDPADIESTVLAAAKAAHAVHVKGTDVENGTTAAVDLQLNADSGSGTLTTQGTTYSIILADRVTYLRFTAGVLKSQGIDPNGPRGRTLLNKWVPSTSKAVLADTFTPYQQILDYTTFVTGTFTVDQDQIVRTGTTSVNGTPVTGYRDTTQHTTALVSTASPHYPLRLTGDTGTDLVLSGWNRPVPVTAPAKADVYPG